MKPQPRGGSRYVLISKEACNLLGINDNTELVWQFEPGRLI